MIQSSHMRLTFDYTLLDLEPRDLLVYEAMLTNPEACSVRTIAAAVQMNRGTTFEIIKKLVRCGMVSAAYKNASKRYRAEPPESLRRYAAQRQRQLAEDLPNVRDYTDRLEKLQPADGGRQFGKQYEGEEEIAVLLQDVLTTVAATPDKTYRVISSAQVRNQMYGKFRNFTHQRIKQGIAVRVIGVGELGGKAELSERKLLSSEQVPASYIIIYGDKVAQITLTHLGNIHGSVVEDAGVTQLQRLLFDRLWETL